MQIVLIDNYDSFSYNLYQMLCRISGEEARVITNDDIVGWNEACATGIDALIISPGPGRPEVPTDFGISRLAVVADVPLLGVCLGHQGLCYFEGGRVGRAPEPVHGRRSAVRHDASALFAGIPSPFEAVRYHSLTVTEIPPALAVTAYTLDAVGQPIVMAVRHRSRPAFGVQFHPESISTEFGERLVQNFLTQAQLASSTVAKQSRKRHESRKVETAGTPKPRPFNAAVTPSEYGPNPTSRTHQVLVRQFEAAPPCEALFDYLFAGDDFAFWLDSSAVLPPLSQFSIIGGAGPLSEYVTTIAGCGVDVRAPDGRLVHYDVDMFAYLQGALDRRRMARPDVPFDFNLGFVGYLGYEMKAECGGDSGFRADTPDAAFLFCDRAVIVDHLGRRTYALTLVPLGEDCAGMEWLATVSRAVAGDLHAPTPHATRARSTKLEVQARSSPEEYANLVRECLSEIRSGETYEVCLTNMMRTKRPDDVRATYRDLRRRSPVPFGAFVHFPEVDILSASPERFLRIDPSGRVEAKPIKGTRPRGQTPEDDQRIADELGSSEKDRAENLMIVDLLRNDLGRVSEIGSVQVPVLFDVESYATVHHLVSTIRSRLRPEVSPVECVRAAFPGGSMTGAPKRRTMQIIDHLEGSSRGVYSGALGYFALSGAIDLSIVIRTIVVVGDAAYVGAGGAVVALSDPDNETAEMQLKAEVPLDSLRATTGPARRLCTVGIDQGAGI